MKYLLVVTLIFFALGCSKDNGALNEHWVVTLVAPVNGAFCMPNPPKYDTIWISYNNTATVDHAAGNVRRIPETKGYHFAYFHFQIP